MTIIKQILLVAMVLLTAACSHYELEDENNIIGNPETPSATGKITFTSENIGEPAKGTRTILGDDGITMNWKVGDKIEVGMIDTDRPQDGVIRNEYYHVTAVDAQTGIATFTGDLRWPAANTQYSFIAYYKGSNISNYGLAHFDCSSRNCYNVEDSQLGEVDALFSEPVIMQSPANISGNISPLSIGLKFHHVFPILEFRFAALNKSDVTISQITIENDLKNICASNLLLDMKLPISDSGFGILDSRNPSFASKRQDMYLLFNPSVPMTTDPLFDTNHLSPADNNVWMVHMAIPPYNYTGTTFTITLRTNKGEFTFTKPGKEMQAGNKYVSTLLIPEPPAKKGDFYYSDDTYSTILDDSKTCIGIVFREKTGSTPGTKGLIVGLDAKSSLQWGPFGDILTGAVSETDGAANLAVIQTIAGWETDYQAFQWCSAKGEGWYLPAVDELKALINAYIDNRTAFNNKLNQAGGSQFRQNETLWTSVEQSEHSAFRIRITDFATVTMGQIVKYSTSSARAVRAF